MKIKYLGHSSFAISGKSSTGDSVTVIIDPFDSKAVGLPYPKTEADIVITSHQHEDHNFLPNIKGEPQKDYFLVDTPGEFEVKGVRIEGIASFHDDKKGLERGINVISAIDIEKIRLVHMGDIGHNLDKTQLEEIDGVDILLIPVGGVYTIDPKTAVHIIEALEPKVVIPMHYKVDGMPATFNELSTLEDFIKEIGLEAKNQDEYKIKSKADLPEVLTIISLNS